MAPRWPGPRRLEADGRRVGFCKTSRQPYDLAVTTILLRCHRLLPDGFPFDWERVTGSRDNG